MGQWDKRNRNEASRTNGNESEPGIHAGVKRRARYLKRAVRVVKVKHPERYLNSYRRGMDAFVRALEMRK